MVKSPKLGCGPMAGVILIALILIFITGNEAIEYYYVDCEDAEFIDCVMGRVEEEILSEGSVAASGEYTYKGYSITVTMHIPLQGGAVTGNVTGTCEGNVKGNFSGQDGGVISGTLSGVCAPFFVNVPAGGQFNGTVNKTGKTVPIGFSGKGGGLSHEGSMTLVWSAPE